MTKAQILARERNWTFRAGFAALVGALLALGGFFFLQSSLGGDANFESLAEADKNSSSVWIAGILTTVGYALLIVPVHFLFRAVQSRSPQVKKQLIGVVVLGPLLLAVSGVVLAAGTQQAANTYLDGKAKLTLTPKEANEKCVSDRKDNGAESFADEFPAAASTSLQACEDKKTEEDKASNAIRDSSLITVGQFSGLAGDLALVIGLMYMGLWSMRTGLLSRFWGSLGMAVGIAALIGFAPIVFVWFIYLGLLLIGKLPSARPPAWAAGEAIPWPTTGQRVAAEIEPPDSDAIDVGEPDPAEDPAPSNGNGGSQRRKRKRRGQG